MTIPNEETMWHLEGMRAAANGSAGTHNPYIFSNLEARRAWDEGFHAVRGAMDREYQRGRGAADPKLRFDLTRGVEVVRPLIEAEGNRITLDCTLILPDGWRMGVYHLTVDTDQRTITPTNDEAVFAIRRVSERQEQP